MNQYCTPWRPKINVSETNELVFLHGYVKNRPEFTFGDIKLDIFRDYQYNKGTDPD